MKWGWARGVLEGEGEGRGRGLGRRFVGDVSGVRQGGRKTRGERERQGPARYLRERAAARHEHSIRVLFHNRRVRQDDRTGGVRARRWRSEIIIV